MSPSCDHRFSVYGLLKTLRMGKEEMNLQNIAYLANDRIGDLIAEAAPSHKRSLERLRETGTRSAAPFTGLVWTRLRDHDLSRHSRASVQSMAPRNCL